MARVNRFSSRIRSQKRRVGWNAGPLTSVGGQVIAASAGSIAATGAAFQLDGLTTVRLRGELLMYLTESSVKDGGFVGAFGVGIVTNAAFTAGAASVPTPITEESWDGWLYHRYFSLLSTSVIADTVSSSDDFGNAVTSVLRLEVDSKAMRKGAIDEVQFAAIEVNEIGVASMTWNFRSRVLDKLP